MSEFRNQERKPVLSADEIQQALTAPVDQGRLVHVLDKVSLYPKFPGVREAHDAMAGVLRKSERGTEFTKEMELLLENLFRATDILDLSLENQDKYKLVDKRWMRTPSFMRDALESGRRTMELDIRMDADGEFWISHATGARASVTPPYIHRMTTEQMRVESSRFSLDEALTVFSEYKSRGHRLILELKTLGPDVEKFPQSVERLLALLDRHDARNAVAVSSLSPGLLMEVHERAPEVPLILNGGIVPCVSYKEQRSDRLEGLLPLDKKWAALGIPGVGEVVVAGSEKTPRRTDGEGTQTGYVMTRLPDDLVSVLRDQKTAGVKFGGLVSLSAVTILASVLDVIGARQKASEMRKYYSDVVDSLGLDKMATTWGQGLSKIPVFGKLFFKKLSPLEQIKTFKKELGHDTLIYTKAPEEFAHLLGDT